MGAIVYEGQESTVDEKKLLDTDDCETAYLNVLKKTVIARELMSRFQRISDGHPYNFSLSIFMKSMILSDDKERAEHF